MCDNIAYDKITVAPIADNLKLLKIEGSGIQKSHYVPERMMAGKV
jgi:hypothetical protein